MRGAIEKKRSNAGAATKHVTTTAILLLAVSLLAGCTVGPNYRQPPTEVPGNFSNLGQTGSSNADVEISWWRGFNDDKLNHLVGLALAGNHDLRIATARVREARALWSEAEFDRFPTVTSQGTYARQRSSETLAAGAPDRDRDLYNVGFDASWELDFFGRVRRSLEAVSADVQAQEASRRDVIVSLLSELARNYVELRGAQNQLAVARRNAENQRETLNLTLAVLEGGRGTELDTSRARAQLTSTLATIPPLETAIKGAIYRLGVLTGQQPTALEQELAEPAPLPRLPQIVSLGQPEDLLRRRPDIRIAERNLAAATARIGVATAELFP
ncbi:MAG: efflux transporter outer membrane subunit, partial [Gammaproteobacteria bacterium]